MLPQMIACLMPEEETGKGKGNTIRDSPLGRIKLVIVELN